MKEDKKSNLIKYIISAMLFSISTFILEIIGFAISFLLWGNLFGDTEAVSLVEFFKSLVVLLIPHLILFGLNMLFIFALYKIMGLNKRFYYTLQSIAILVFLLPWCIIFFAMLIYALS